jgi:hypothetical protein
MFSLLFLHIAMDSSGDGDFLILILDTLAFSHDHDERTTSKLLEQVLVFVGAYRLLSDSNELFVFGLDEGTASCTPLYSSLGENWGEPLDKHLEPMHKDHQLQPWLHQHPYQCIKDGMLRLLQGGSSKETTKPKSGTIPLAGALSRSLCLIHRIASNSIDSTNSGHLGRKHSSKPRILCITGHQDDQTSYVPMMNCIFSAQVKGLIDLYVFRPF